MEEPNWERLATKDDMNRLLTFILNRLDAVIKADRDASACELKGWKRILGRKKLGQIISQQTNQQPKALGSYKRLRRGSVSLHAPGRLLRITLDTP